MQRAERGEGERERGRACSSLAAGGEREAADRADARRKHGAQLLRLLLLAFPRDGSVAAVGKLGSLVLDDVAAFLKQVELDYDLLSDLRQRDPAARRAGGIFCKGFNRACEI